MTEEIKILTIRELLSSGSEYTIPIYQRNYAWGADEIKQLIQDVIDYATLEDEKKDYYIGTLVVSRNDVSLPYQTIDGQQRLTTLSILTAAIKNTTNIDLSFFVDSNLSYKSRERSSRSLQNIFQNNPDAEDMEENIISAYEICLKELAKQLPEHHISVEQFTDYLFDFVKILRVPLPTDIDLNHYFEIMNSRGEQLEKHEILKAQLMAVFNHCDQIDVPIFQACFDLIWQSCSDMETYVQFGFSVDQRNEIFNWQTWDMLTVSSFDEIVDKLRKNINTENSDSLESIDQILSGRPTKSNTGSESDSPDRFNSVINFPNFLLHVLRVQSGENDVHLDDKRLLTIFEPYIKSDHDSTLSFVKDFAFNLLKCKMLFDKYIIKREFTGNTDRWSLKSLRKSGASYKNVARYNATFAEENGDAFDSNNRRILMLLSMFHVSNPSMIYKYWLSAALNYLFVQFEVDGGNYIAYLENIAKAFVYDRFLINESVGLKGEYSDLIQKGYYPISRAINSLDHSKTVYHHIENNLVFNFLDYLIWLRYKNENLDPRVRTFEFTFRSSVEHYYPQKAFDEDIKTLKDEDLHSFGNLCLISGEKNSKLRNFTPSGKKDFYPSNKPIDSLKQFLMMREQNWTDEEINLHGAAMMTMLEDNRNSYYSSVENITLASKWFKQYRITDPVLLARTLFCFGDTAKYISNDKYNFLDINLIRNKEEYLQFEKYVDEYSPVSLNDIIKQKLLDNDLRQSWRYPFVKFAEVMNYCSEGNFLYQSDDGRMIKLLQSKNKGKNNYRSLYNFIIEKYLSELFSVKLWSDSEKVYLDIDYDEDQFKIVSTGNDEYFSVVIWEEAGESIQVQLHSRVNGNSAASRKLSDFGWEKGNNRIFIRPDGETLCLLTKNSHRNISTIENKIKNLLKVGFGIKVTKNN